MDVSPVDVLIFAPLAPVLGLLLFWFIQLLFIESQKYFLSFIGVLFQSICHALGYTVTRSGISHFHVSIHYGKVKPKKEKTGIFEWISNSFLFLGPFFIPAALLLICLFFLINTASFTFSTGTHVTFATGLQTFGENLYGFSEGLFSYLFSIDLLHPAHLGFLLLLIFLGMGIRPSYTGEEQRKKVDMIYDLKNIKDHVLHRPLYVVLLFLIAYVFFYVSFLFEQNWYVMVFSLFGWLSIIAIVSLLITHTIILLIRITDEIPRPWKFIPYIVILLSYIFARVFFYYFPIEHLRSVSLVIMIVSTVIITILLLRYKTNRFKTKTKMKQLRVEDGPKRIIKQ